MSQTRRINSGGHWRGRSFNTSYKGHDPNHYVFYILSAHIKAIDDNCGGRKRTNVEDDVYEMEAGGCNA